MTCCSGVLTTLGGRSSRFIPRPHPPPITKRPNTAGPEIRAHLERAIQGSPSGADAWLHEPDVPTEADIAKILAGRPKDKYGQPLHIPMTGSFESQAEYFRTHYELLRYDTLEPLCLAVDEINGRPNILESSSKENARIYDKVFITGLTLAREGFALEVEFSLNRVGKKILWAQSKRLKTGTAVILTPAKDYFRSKTIVAIVASRRLAQLEVSHPQRPKVHLYVGDPGKVEIDSQVEYLMVEGNGGYWESSRHVLKALQQMTDEK